MADKCYKCIFKGEYRDHGASVQTCDRCCDLLSAIRATEGPGPCRFHITIDQVVKLQEMGIDATFLHTCEERGVDSIILAD